MQVAFGRVRRKTAPTGELRKFYLTKDRFKQFYSITINRKLQSDTAKEYYVTDRKSQDWTQSRFR